MAQEKNIRRDGKMKSPRPQEKKTILTCINRCYAEDKNTACLCFKEGIAEGRRLCLEKVRKIIDKFDFDKHILNYDGDLIFLTEGKEELKAELSKLDNHSPQKHNLSDGAKCGCCSPVTADKPANSLRGRLRGKFISTDEMRKKLEGKKC